MDKKVILIGGFHEIIELCEEANFEVVGIIDNNIIGSYLGYPIIGTDDEAQLLFNEYGKIPLIITPDYPLLREKLVCKYSVIGYKFKTLISPQSKISKYANIGNGTVIQSGVNVSSFSTIGDFVKLNVNCNIMHDTIIEEYATIAPNSVVLGRVKIGKKSYIGANSTILPEIQIDDNVMVGAGAVVTKNVISNSIIKGVPAK